VKDDTDQEVISKFVPQPAEVLGVALAGSGIRLDLKGDDLPPGYFGE